MKLIPRRGGCSSACRNPPSFFTLRPELVPGSFDDGKLLGVSSVLSGGRMDMLERYFVSSAFSVSWIDRSGNHKDDPSSFAIRPDPWGPVGLDSIRLVKLIQSSNVVTPREGALVLLRLVRRRD